MSKSLTPGMHVKSCLCALFNQAPRQDAKWVALSEKW